MFMISDKKTEKNNIFYSIQGFPPDTPLVLYEEIKPDFVEKINNYNDPLEKVLFISCTLSNLFLVLRTYFLYQSDLNCR